MNCFLKAGYPIFTEKEVFSMENKNTNETKEQRDQIVELGADITKSKKGNIYTKQFKVFGDLVAAGKTDYSNAEQALHIQKLCDDIYANG